MFYAHCEIYPTKRNVRKKIVFSYGKVELVKKVCMLNFSHYNSYIMRYDYVYKHTELIILIIGSYIIVRLSYIK